MKHAALLALSLACLVSCNHDAHKPDPNAMIEAAKKLDQAFLDAFNKGDAAAASALYWDNPEVVSISPEGMQSRGLPAIQQNFSAGFASMKGAKLEVTEVHYIPLADSVITWGLFKMTIPTPDGKTTETVGRYSDVKAERNGKWVFLMDHTSVPFPQPPPAK